MGVYILLFERKIGTDKHSCQYYVGFVDDSNGTAPEVALAKRMVEHRAGTGAALTRWANKERIGYEVILFIPFLSRVEERRIKNQKNTKLYVARWFKKQKREFLAP